MYTSNSVFVTIDPVSSPINVTTLELGDRNLTLYVVSFKWTHAWKNFRIRAEVHEIWSRHKACMGNLTTNQGS